MELNVPHTLFADGAALARASCTSTEELEILVMRRTPVLGPLHWLADGPKYASHDDDGGYQTYTDREVEV